MLPLVIDPVVIVGEVVLEPVPTAPSTYDIVDPLVGTTSINVTARRVVVTFVVIVITVPVVNMPPFMGEVNIAPSTPLFAPAGLYKGEIRLVHVFPKVSVSVNVL
jgi:hypothetical protein